MIQRPGDKRYLFIARDIWDTIIRDYLVPYKDLNRHLNPPTLIPSKDGEPLLNKHLPELLKSASDAAPDIHIDIYSHGLLLPRQPGFIDFLGSLPNKVRLMVTYHFYNHDGSENDYTATTRYLRERIHNWPRNVELIIVSHLIEPMTRERLDTWKATWDGFPATVVANALINPWTGLIQSEHLSRHAGCPHEKFECMFFGATGNILSCCMDLEEEIVHGNVMKDDPAKMVATVQEFYAAQKRREVKHAVCADCFGMKREDVMPLLQLGVPA